ncbi:adenylate cyclase [Nitrosomonas cryotolerans]|uniref:Adenylate cyclase n=1 Tax=Nitrosomonas cryotolerans ATCC 49181 TaxID=1131553 RepID=A0A1N6FUW2_9PROT|nr:adenylate/guanylate cyclase domain-containing protein [Nitrosomonas cryotolerans]SFP76487.1 adenylate cyclase [Nitrosomonas cryotolerans]SIN99048.1 adenylate cyclase [Nitrosomonas cryotolerans ATCC 49181]
MLRLFKRLVLGLCVGLFGVMIALAPFGLALEEQFGLPGLFYLRGAISSPDDVVVVAIDQRSARHLNLPLNPRSWPRDLHARLIERLTEAGAGVIVFDLIFDTHGNVPAHDAALAQAMAAARNVVLVERLSSEDVELLMEPSDQAQYKITQEGTIQPIPIIADAALVCAPFPLPKLSRVNGYWAFKAGAGDMPTLPVAALQVFALPVYADFTRLLAHNSPGYTEQLVVNSAAPDIEALLFTLRNMLVNVPGLAQKMLVELQRNTSLNADTKRMLRALISAYVGTEIRYLNFYGPPRSVRTIPYYQLVQSATDPAALNDAFESIFKGKAVFIGFSAETQSGQDRIRDDYHTVFPGADGLTMSGVEIAATAFANLLENKPIKPVSLIVGLSILFLLGVVMGAAFLMLSNRSGAFVVIVLILIYVGHAYYQFEAMGLWLPLIIPLFLQMPLALFGAGLLKYVAARREGKQVKDAFGYFLPERVVNDIAKSAGKVSANTQLVYGVCLATDADKYTTLAERMSPRQLSQLMNDYYAVLFEPVRKQGGIVSDVVGDAMFAIWAPPFLDADLRKQACLACLDIVAAVAHFNQINSEMQLPTRVGLHFGEILLGNVGALHHYEYRAVGDIVNTTSRIQGVNKYLGTNALLSSEVIVGQADFLTRPLGNFLLAGKSSVVNLSELVAHKQTASYEQYWLCERFTHALQAYELKKWNEASSGFLEILDIFPADGPARLFLNDSLQYEASPPPESWFPVMRIDGK